MTVRGRPLGLVLIAALLIVLSLRAVIWLLGGWLMGENFVGTGRAPVYVVIFAAGLASAIGLLLLQRWARWLALALCSGYSVLLVVGLIAGWASVGLGGIGLARALTSGLESAAVAGASWWYLTRPNVLRLFERPAD